MRGVIRSVLRSGRAGILAGAMILAGVGSAVGQQAVPNPHGPLPEGLDCSACHTAQGWRTLRDPVGFQHGAKTDRLMLGGHAQTPCASCHLDLRFDGPDIAMSDCASCHADVHQGQMIQGCIDCHTPMSFHDVQGESIHARTSFPLTGAHRQVTCESCHVNDQGGAFSALDTDCVSCHLPAYESAATVDHAASGYPTDCTQCHSTLSWGDAPAFDHISISDGFELLGAHGHLRCASCHTVPGMEPIFQAADQNDCVACHSRDYDRKHGGSDVPTTCLSCHSVDSWDASDFDHALVGFQLLGKHADLGCSRCHTEGQAGLKFTKPAGQNDCVACHQSDYNKEHAGSGFPTTCLTCHNLNDWDAKGFNHSVTAFPLEGAHTSQNCVDCHGAPAHLSAAFQSAQSCASCHQTDYDTQHTGSGFPSMCLSCHTQTSWTFDHTTLVGGFSLDGPHVSTACASCHTLPAMGLNFPVPADQGDCVACHQADYDANHAGSGVPTTCLGCHSGDKWTDPVFDHTANTGFALLDSHATALCTSCHNVPDYSLKFPVPTNQQDCAACHQTDYDANHAGSSFPTTCLSCHTQTTWQGAVFDHTANTGFALLDSHATALCTSCHNVPDYSLKFSTPASQQDCASCHQTDYDANHAGSNFPTTCLDCHTQKVWTGAVFDHVGQSGFDLIDSHAAAPCTSCHNPDNTLKFSTPASQQDCASCHQTDYDANHAGSNFPTTCLDCHTQTVWTGAVFDHVANSGFPLVGPHAPLVCTDCHAGPNYALLFPKPASASDCVACHQGDYDANHTGSGFPNTCLDCHGPNAWLPATVDHVAVGKGFALLGAHSVATCASCHAIPGYTLLFPTPSSQTDCVACHQTDYVWGHGATGYPTDCAACHTVNAWKPSTFNHDSQYFPIYSGKHSQEWSNCTDCHTSPSDLTVFSCLTCHEHRQSDMDDKHRGRQGYTYTSGACLSCHPTGRKD